MLLSDDPLTDVIDLSLDDRRSFETYLGAL